MYMMFIDNLLLLISISLQEMGY
ncbi:uncharacterized protein METZ01_LOCUS105590 [marine metagenome]|uniref:Uncharacterized protein n=1 Tax=marine metagenome TaxID=408172 RepID=A0A381WJQ4_9ZZZZ